MLTRFTDKRICRHVNNGFNPVSRQRFLQRRSIGQISLYKCGAINESFAVTLIKAVIHDDFVAVFQQFFSDHAADITGATCYQNFHWGTPCCVLEADGGSGSAQKRTISLRRHLKLHIPIGRHYNCRLRRKSILKRRDNLRASFVNQTFSATRPGSLRYNSERGMGRRTDGTPAVGSTQTNSLPYAKR